MKERNAALEKTERNESFFDKMQGEKPFDVVQRFWLKLNELNYISRGERNGFAFEKKCSALLQMVSGVVKIIIIA